MSQSWHLVLKARYFTLIASCGTIKHKFHAVGLGVPVKEPIALERVGSITFVFLVNIQASLFTGYSKALELQ